MTPKVYMTHGSAPCRLVRLVALLCNYNIEIVEIDMAKGEHKTEEYIKLNPRHCVPCLVDYDLVMTESRAIAQRILILTESDFIPDNINDRSKVDEMVQYDLGITYKRIGEFVYPQIFAGATADPDKKQMVKSSLTYLNNILSKTDNLAGANGFTLADLTTRVSLTMLEFTDIDFVEYPHLSAWMKRVEDINREAWNVVNLPFKIWVESTKNKSH
jgi:glutathione S-transferase